MNRDIFQNEHRKVLVLKKKKKKNLLEKIWIVFDVLSKDQVGVCLLI